MSRGDIVTVVFPGAYGKPRPAVLIQDDAFEALPSVTVLPLTSDVRHLPPLRITIEPGPESGLKRRSQVQIDKVMSVPRARVGALVGTLPQDTMEKVGDALARFLGLD